MLGQKIEICHLLSSDCPAPRFKGTDPDISIVLGPDQLPAEIEQVGHSHMRGYESLSRSTVPLGLKLFINHFAILVYGPPQVMLLATYFHEDLIDEAGD